MSKPSLFRTIAYIFTIISLVAVSPSAMAKSGQTNNSFIEPPLSSGIHEIPVDPMVQVVIDQVTPDQLMTYDRQLAGELPVWVDGAWYTIPTRYTYSGQPIQKTAHWVGQHLQDLGLEVEYQEWNNQTNPNVIGQITGLNNPDDIFIIGGHLDAAEGTPGADDDGTGSASTLLAADILSQYQWGCTLRFAFWTGEEQWMLGSSAYADMAHARGDNIIGYLNLDMLGWNTIGSEPAFELWYEPSVPGSQEMAQLFSDAVYAYDLNLVPHLILDWGRGGDHESFWDNDYASVMVIEDYTNDFNPYYHGGGLGAQDLPENLDQGYFTEYTKAALATFLHMNGCMITSGLGSLDGYVTDASGGAPIENSAVAIEDEAGHVFTAETDVTGYYTQTLLSGTYTATASAYGYLPETMSGLLVTTDTVTTHDFSLQEAPRYSVSGQIRETGSQVPLLAHIEFEGSPETIDTDASGYYSIELPEGDYVMHVNAPSHQPAERVIVVDHDQIQDFSLDPLPCILLVDDDQDGPDVRSSYTQALDALGLEYDVWDVSTEGSPSEADLSGYRMLGWFLGYPWSATLTGENEAAVSTYLDGGGKFFLSGQDYLYDRGLTAFGQNYLHIGGFNNDVSQTTAAGANVFAGLGPYTLSYPYSNYSDIVNPDASAQVAFTGNQGNSAVSYDSPEFQTAFFGFPLESLPPGGLNAVLDRMVEHFGGCEYIYGLLEGAVTDSEGGLPIPGAQITAQPGDIAGTTGVDGTYLLSLPQGIYDVTAGAACYLPQTTSSVEITAGLTTTQDFALIPVGPPAGLGVTWSPELPSTGVTVTFTATVDNPDGLDYQWAISDGFTGSGVTISHIFTNPGQYTVDLIVDNGCGGTAQVSFTIYVEAVNWKVYLPVIEMTGDE